jgi:hypothetical protein
MSLEEKGTQTMAVPETRETGSVETLKGVAPEPEPRRRRWWIPTLILILVAAAATWWYLMQSGGEEAADTTVGVELAFAEVVVTDLVETSEYEGTLGRLAGDPVSVRAEGTVTALPEAGTTLAQGDVVAWVDNQPVVLLYGELPMWREMRDDTEGPDVLQLETALTALGYNESESSMTVDDTFTGATGSVVETWQEAIGAEDDGVVGIGEVVFVPGPVKVDALQMAAGDVIGGNTPVFTTAGEDIQVSFGLPTFEQDNVEVGDAVEITLPDLSTTTGVVTEIAAAATSPEGGGDVTFETIVELDDPSLAAGIDEAPVTVAVITDRADQVTAVPVEALVALAEGGYAVEVEDGSGTRLVAVDPGFYADGLVEVSGDVVPGDRVVVP